MPLYEILTNETLAESGSCMRFLEGQGVGGVGKGEGESEGEGGGELSMMVRSVLGGSLTHHLVFAKWTIRSTCPTPYQVSKPLKLRFTKWMR
jgi:hypothetical protein